MRAAPYPGAVSTPARTSADGPSAASDETQIGVGIGRQVRQARTEKKLSMRALASAAEISQPFLSQIESGQTMPSLLTLYRIANALDISPSALLPTDPDPEVVHVSRAADATWVPVSEASDTAHTRVIHAGETSLQEYVIRPGTGSRRMAKSSTTSSKAPSRSRSKDSGSGNSAPGMPWRIPVRCGTGGTFAGMGRPGSRSSTPAGRRRLSSVPCSFVRIFLHGA